MATLLPRRIPLMPLAGLAIALIAAVVAFLISHAMAQTDRAVSHSIQVRVGLADLGRHVAEQNAGFRGFLLLGAAEQQDEAIRGGAAVVAQYARLHDLLISEPTQRANLDALAPMLRERIEYVHSQIGSRQRGGSGLASAASRDHVRRLVAGIDDRLHDMGIEEERLLDLRQQRAQRLVAWLSVALAASVMMVVLIAYLTVRDARQRFLALRDATREARAAAIDAAREAAGRAEAEAQLRQIQKMESIGQLTGGIAHDFNNMLAVIVGSLDLARRRIDQPDQVSRHISNALEGAGRATTLVSRLLAFSRRQALTPAIVPTGAFLADLAELLRRTLGEAITVATKLDPASWPLFADPVQLESAILNLAVNARDAMPGGGLLTIATRNITLRSGPEAANADLPPGDYIELSVTDSGTGMTQETIARAFDPFFTTKAVGKGTGLGLSQVFGFVRQSGGNVSIESEPGKRTTVRMLLPRHTGGPRPGVQRPVIEEHPGGHGERVLLAEDDERVRRFSADALRELGYHPIPAANGAEALQLLLGEPEVVILFTDVVMPGMTGQELAAAVRTIRPGIKVLYTTGYARDGDNALGLASLDAPVLLKPFDIADLAAKLRDILDG